MKQVKQVICLLHPKDHKENVVIEDLLKTMTAVGMSAWRQLCC